jgi:endonuclease/exonuclease/phosphatase family metal-dependent hydrolase
MLLFMKKTFFLLLAFLPLYLLAQTPLHVITFNIRYYNAGDSLNAWPFRKDKAASQILFHGAHIVGVQEALHGQLVDLAERLPQYKWVGAGRDDGKEGGEYSAIFYDTARLQVLGSKTFWLSENPDAVGVKGWDAAYPRVVTWAKFRDRKTGKVFFHFNTHFDHMGKVARRESARLLLQQVAAIAGKTQAIITGDFNAQPTDEPIKLITDAANPLHLMDSKSISQQRHYGPDGTFNAFGPKEIYDAPIDYIFLHGNIKVLQHATLSQTWGGRFSSDHFPVFASLVL